MSWARKQNSSGQATSISRAGERGQKALLADPFFMRASDLGLFFRTMKRKYSNTFFTFSQALVPIVASPPRLVWPFDPT